MSKRKRVPKDGEPISNPAPPPSESKRPEKVARKSYWEKLKDPRWQERRLRIMDRAKFTCEHCGGTTVTLNVHHTYYERGKEPWEYPDEALQCLCEPCHEIAEAVRLEAVKAIGRLSPKSQAEAVEYLRRLGPATAIAERLDPRERELCLLAIDPVAAFFHRKKLLGPAPTQPTGAVALDPRERELLELLCIHPQLATMALQKLSSEDLPSLAAREVFSVYRQLEGAGQSLEFPVVLGELPEHLKGLLIELDERAGRKEPKAMLEAPSRMQSAIERLRSETDMENREKLAVLEEWQLDTQEEKKILAELGQQLLKKFGLQPK